MRFSKIIVLLFICTSIFAQKRELRGVWIANVSNVDWPSSKTLTADQQRAELIAFLDLHQKQGINAVFFQIRNACDAVYQSDIEPWSEWLMGVQGQSPGYDPLAFMIQECRKRNIEIHAWLNPYRAVVDATRSSVAANHVTKTRPEWIQSYNTLKILDPGLPQVRSYVNQVVMDVVRRYDIDGIHFDDYFYPYPQTGFTFNDDATFAQHSRGITNRSDWRRDNVNILIKNVSDSIRATKPWVKFGVSPFGIWQNRGSSSLGSATTGLESYSSNYADSRKWAQQGWLDYILPQVYWSIGNTAANFAVLVPWWIENSFNTQLFIGHAAYKISTDADTRWSSGNEIPSQIKLLRNTPAVAGSVYFSAKSLRNNLLGVSDSLAKNYYSRPALIPTMNWKDNLPPAAPTRATIKLNDDNTVALAWAHPYTPTAEMDKVRYFVIYRGDNQNPLELRTGNSIRAIVPLLTAQSTYSFTDKAVDAGNRYSYTITAVDRLHNESTATDILSPTVLTAVNQPVTDFQPTVQLQSDGLEAYPNPFNRLVNLRYKLEKNAYVRLMVYDERGVKVAALVNEAQMSGKHLAQFNGDFLSEGTYVVRLEIDGQLARSLKLVLNP